MHYSASKRLQLDTSTPSNSFEVFALSELVPTDDGRAWALSDRVVEHLHRPYNQFRAST